MRRHINVNPHPSEFGAGIIGLTISNAMYGVSLGQAAYYARYFPNDPSSLKLLVVFVVVIDALNLIGAPGSNWPLVIPCHRADLSICEKYLTWAAYICLLTNYILTFTVQCFYSHRVWIISSGKRIIVSIIPSHNSHSAYVSLVSWFLPFTTMTCQLVPGAFAETFKIPTIFFVYSTPIIPIASGVSTACDLVITGTIFKYLWRSELRGHSHVLRDLLIVFINMGALTCAISIVVGVVFLAQGSNYWIAAPGLIICRCYSNSFFAVLNARRMIHERELRRVNRPNAVAP